MIDYRITEFVEKINLKKQFHKEYAMGINLIGPVRTAMGLGQSYRLLADILENTEYDFCIKEFNYLEMKEKL